MAEPQNVVPPAPEAPKPMTPAESLALAKAEVAAASRSEQGTQGGENGASSIAAGVGTDRNLPQSPAPPVETAKEPPKEDSSAEVMKRSAAIAERERRLREGKKENKAATERAARLDLIEAAAKAGDDLKLLELLGVDPDVAYQRLTRTFLEQKPELTPDQVIDQKVEAKLKAARDADQKTRNDAAAADATKVREQYFAKTYEVLDAAVDKYPDVVKALGTRKLKEQDIADLAEGFFAETGRPPTPELILGLIQEQLAPKVESKTEAAESKTAAKPIVPANSSWTNHAPPQPPAAMTREESLREAKRAVGLLV